MDFSVFTDTDIEKLMKKMKQKSTADAFGTLLQKAGGEEKMKRQLQENLSQEKTKEDLSRWYGGKKANYRGGRAYRSLFDWVFEIR